MKIKNFLVCSIAALSMSIVSCNHNKEYKGNPHSLLDAAKMRQEAQQQGEMDGVFFKNYRYVTMIVTADGDDSECVVGITMDKQNKIASLNIIKEQNEYGPTTYNSDYFNDMSPMTLQASGNSCKGTKGGRDFNFTVADFGSEVEFGKSGNPARRIRLSKGRADSLLSIGMGSVRILEFKSNAVLIGHNEMTTSNSPM